MKKSLLYLMMACLSFTLFPAQSFAVVPVSTSAPVASPDPPADIQARLDRLVEIKEMDKSNLTSAEKKALRKEVRATKAYLAENGNGVYLSVGAIIIIILLLILLL